MPNCACSFFVRLLSQFSIQGDLEMNKTFSTPDLNGPVLSVKRKSCFEITKVAFQRDSDDESEDSLDHSLLDPSPSHKNTVANAAVRLFDSSIGCQDVKKLNGFAKTRFKIFRYKRLKGRWQCFDFLDQDAFHSSYSAVNLTTVEEHEVAEQSSLITNDPEEVVSKKVTFSINPSNFETSSKLFSMPSLSSSIISSKCNKFNEISCHNNSSNNLKIEDRLHHIQEKEHVIKTVEVSSFSNNFSTSVMTSVPNPSISIISFPSSATESSSIAKSNDFLTAVHESTLLLNSISCNSQNSPSINASYSPSSSSFSTQIFQSSNPTDKKDPKLEYQNSSTEISDKISQALDLAKQHLISTTHREIESLKMRINYLQQLVVKLEEENRQLRSFNHNHNNVNLRNNDNNHDNSDNDQDNTNNENRKNDNEIAFYKENNYINTNTNTNHRSNNSYRLINNVSKNDHVIKKDFLFLSNNENYIEEPVSKQSNCFNESKNKQSDQINFNNKNSYKDVDAKNEKITFKKMISDSNNYELNFSNSNCNKSFETFVSDNSFTIKNCNSKNNNFHNNTNNFSNYNVNKNNDDNNNYYYYKKLNDFHNKFQNSDGENCWKQNSNNNSMDYKYKSKHTSTVNNGNKNNNNSYNYYYYYYKNTNNVIHQNQIPKTSNHNSQNDNMNDKKNHKNICIINDNINIRNDNNVNNINKYNDFEKNNENPNQNRCFNLRNSFNESETYDKCPGNKISRNYFFNNNETKIYNNKYFSDNNITHNDSDINSNLHNYKIFKTSMDLYDWNSNNSVSEEYHDHNNNYTNNNTSINKNKLKNNTNINLNFEYHFNNHNRNLFGTDVNNNEHHLHNHPNSSNYINKQQYLI